MERMRMVIVALVCAGVMGAGIAAGAAGAGEQEAKTAVASRAPLDLNAASVVDLERLPGIGPAMATRILEYDRRTVVSRSSRS